MSIANVLFSFKTGICEKPHAQLSLVIEKWLNVPKLAPLFA